MGLFDDGFEGYEKKRSYGERVSISASGGLSINATAYQRLGLAKYQYAMFFYNKSNAQVGIRFMQDKKTGAYALNARETSGNSALYMSIKGFVAAYHVVRQGRVQKYNITQEQTTDKVLEVILTPTED